MKNSIFFLIFALLFSVHLAAEPTARSGNPKKSAAEAPPKIDISLLKAEDQETLKRMVTFELLHEVQSSLEAYYNRNDKEALSDLLEVWNSEQQIEIKKDFTSYTEKPEFRVQGTSLFIATKKGQVEFKVDDPFEGRYRINGKAIQIQPYTTYQVIKDRLNEIAKNSSNSNLIFELLNPRAHAAGPAIPVIMACVRFCRPIATAAGGFVTKKALPAAARAIRFAGKETWDFGKHIIYTVTFTCLLSSQSFGTPCEQIPGKVMCSAGVKKDCVAKVSDLEPMIVESDASTANKITVIKPGNENKCLATQTGFSKEVKILLLDANDIKKAHLKDPNAPLPAPSATSELHLEYQKNPKDPQKLIKKTITEIIKSDKGVIEGKRIWTFEGDDFIVDYYDGKNLKNDERLPQAYRQPPKKIDCKGPNAKTTECRTLSQQVLGTLGDNINCHVDNAASVIDKIKSEQTKSTQ